MGWISSLFGQESFSCDQKIYYSYPYKLSNLDGGLPWQIIDLDKATPKKESEFFPQSDRPIRLFERDITLTDRIIKVVDKDSKGMYTTSGARKVTLDNSTLILESEGPVQIDGTFVLINNSKLIIKTGIGQEVWFRGVGVGTNEISDNSSMRIFSGGDINFTGTVKFTLGRDGPDFDGSTLKLYANDDIHFKENATFERWANGYGQFAARDYIIVGTGGLNYSPIVKIRGLSTNSDTGEKYGWDFLAGEEVRARRAQITGTVTLGNDFSFGVELGADVFDISNDIFLFRGWDESLDNSPNKAPNLCPWGYVNWDYDFHFDCQTSDPNKPNCPPSQYERQSRISRFFDDPNAAIDPASIYNTDARYLMYPNPAESELNIVGNKVQEIQIQSIKLFEINGSLIKDYTGLNVDAYKISLQNLGAMKHIVVTITDTSGDTVTEIIERNP